MRRPGPTADPSTVAHQVGLPVLPLQAGLSEAERWRLTTALKPLQRSASPFANVDSDIARWVHAELVGDVEYREFSGTLRHPSWKGLRVDVDCELVTLPVG